MTAMLAMGNTDRISYVLLFPRWLSTWQIPLNNLRMIPMKDPQGKEGGRFSFSFPDEISSESQLLLNSLILGLTAIRDEYGAEYINFRYREV